MGSFPSCNSMASTVVPLRQQNNTSFPSYESPADSEEWPEWADGDEELPAEGKEKWSEWADGDEERPAEGKGKWPEWADGGQAWAGFGGHGDHVEETSPQQPASLFRITRNEGRIRVTSQDGETTTETANVSTAAIIADLVNGLYADEDE